MKALSIDLRKRLLQAYQRGEGSPRQLAQRFAVGHATVERLLARFRTSGTIEAKQYRHGRLPIIQEQDYALIAEWLEAESDLTQQELADRFTAQTGRRVSQRTMSRVLRRMHQTRKKRP